MTLQEILRVKDKCGGCRHQDRVIYEEECFNCSTRIEFGQAVDNDLADNYELEESLKSIEEKAAKWDVIEWAMDNKIDFMRMSEHNSHVDKDDFEILQFWYKEREKSE